MKNISPRITLFNPALSTLNLGDIIIFDSIQKELDAAFPNAFRFEVSTHLPLSYKYMWLAKEFFPRIVCGTNILSSNMWKTKQWDLRVPDGFYLKDLILMGVGWKEYQAKPTRYTRWLLNRILSKTHLHSVRDSYTERKLASIGITNVINTGCPTLWSFTPEKCEEIPRDKAKNVVFTLTNYRPSSGDDNEFIRALRANYEHIYYWIQGAGDIKYIQTLDEFKDDITIIPPRLDRYDQLLSSDTDIEYVGTRLHGGIRAMQFGRRSVIIAVDNRAKEKKKDFNLNIFEREQIREIGDHLNQSIPTRLALAFDAIEQWRQQLQKLASEHR